MNLKARPVGKNLRRPGYTPRTAGLGFISEKEVK
jgi:hypothetical protein